MAGVNYGRKREIITKMSRSVRKADEDGTGPFSGYMYLDFVIAEDSRTTYTSG